MAECAAAEAATVSSSISTVSASGLQTRQDWLAVEEPLEIRLVYSFKGQRHAKPISVTMRTPGHDRELATGFLLGEGIVQHPDEIADIHHVGPGASNEIQVELREDVDVDLARLERHFYTTSSCGVCGKTSLDALTVQGCESLADDRLQVTPAVVHLLPERLRAAQAAFERTGGLHASALFDRKGEVLSLREDVGRHNALDKLVGEQFLAGRLPLRERLLLVSGRASFELLQKSLAAGIPLVAAVGAPSSLAVDLARRFGITLLGFVREGHFNIYSGSWRILTEEQ